MLNIYSLIIQDYLNGETRNINTISSRIKRNKRFNRNANRIFKRKAKYIGYIFGVTQFSMEMLNPFAAPNQ